MASVLRCLLMPKGLAPIALTETQKVELESLARSRTSASGPVMRARMTFRCADGQSNRQLALRVKPHAVGMRRKRFERDGCTGLFDAERSGSPAIIAPALKQKIVNTACHKPPKGSASGARGAFGKARHQSRRRLSRSP